MDVLLLVDTNAGEPARFGIENLSKALKSLGYTVSIINTFRFSSLKTYNDSSYEIVCSKTNSFPLEEVKINSDEVPKGEESYSLIKIREGSYLILGYDDIGLMYGCFDFAEQLEVLKKEINSITPHIKFPEVRIRGLYTFLHNSDIEKEWFYSKEYWEEFLSMLAYNRYNEFDLVFGHQTSHLIPIYPYLFKIEEYPQVYVEGLSEEEQKANLATLQYISSLCKKRGIKFYLGIWQSRPWQVKNGKIEGLHIQESKVKGLSDEILIDYTRIGIKKLLQLCPDIDGIQLRMNIESGISNQNFFVDAFIPGIKSSGRNIEVELRNWGLKIETLNNFKQYFPKLRVSFKYFAEHQAMPYQPPSRGNSYSYDDLVRNDRDYDILWQVWNLGTHRLFLWGDPEYVKNFISSVHLGESLGFHITPPLSQKGFSQYGERPGYWSIYKENVKPWYKWEYERYWFFYSLWGRLGYDLEIDDDFWINMFNNRFGDQRGEYILEAYKWASKVISYLISHHMADPNMYIWLELDNGGLIDFFSKIPPGETTLFMNTEEYVRNVLEDKSSAKITPLQASEHLLEISRHLDEILKKLESIASVENNKEYELTMVDMKALSLLAKYNAKKILASTNLELFYKTSHFEFIKSAEKNIEESLSIWRELASLTDKYFYDELQLGPTGGSWKYNLPYVEYDVRRIKAVKEIFERYGLFLYGFDFGSPQEKGELTSLWYEHPTSNTLEPRFTLVTPETVYNPEVGFGWLDNKGLFSKRAPVINSWGLRGTHHHELNIPIEEFPSEMLSPDYIGGKGKSTFRIDVPKKGRYIIYILTGDLSEDPIFHGPMRVSVNGKLIESEIPIGEIKEIKEIVDASDCIELTFEPLGKDWIVNGIIVQSCDTPQISHSPIKIANYGEGLVIKVTVFCPAERPFVKLFYREENSSKYRVLDMEQKDSFTYSAELPVIKQDIEYYMEITTNRSKVRYPEDFNLKVKVLPPEYKKPLVIKHNPLNSFIHGEDLEFILEVADDRFISEVKLYIREVNQKEDFHCISMVKAEVNKYYARVNTMDFLENYDLMYYFEIVDEFGNGVFYPDPINNFSYGKRYFIIKETKMNKSSRTS